MFAKLLIANRGEIAVRIMRSAKRLGIRTVAVYSDADKTAMHVEMADEAWRIGAPAAAQSYLDQGAILAVAGKSGAEAIHPGYGFLAENPDFAAAVAAAGRVFVGPPAAAIRALGHKDAAKRLMAKAGVPLLPGYHGALQDLPALAREARKTGFPLLIKPVAGGGGKGMRRVNGAAELESELAASQREARAAFGDDRVLFEKYVGKARHIEVQIMADAHGNVLHLFERDCSLQRRHQKVVEETPAPGMTEAMRGKLCAAAIAAARSVNYVGAGTVEFLADVSDGLRPDRFYFMEMNTRLQVEHPVTEMVTGLDLVELQLRVANGEPLPFRQEEVNFQGHAIEARLYAEDPGRGFQPQTGVLTRLAFPAESCVRIDSGVRAGDVIQPYYDPMIAKLIVHAPVRAEAVARLARFLAHGDVAGCRTNLGFLSRLLRHPRVAAGVVDTQLIESEIDALLAAAVLPLEAAAAAMLQVCGYLDAPRSPSPFDTLAGFRLWGHESRAAIFLSGGEPLARGLRRDGDHFTVSAGEQTLCFRILSANATGLRLDCDDRVVALSVFAEDDRLAVALGDGRYELQLPASNALHGAADSGGDVISPVPGLIRSILVTPGDPVARGATVAIIEAMKMEFALKAERDGKVAAVHAVAGALVSEGSVLLVIGDG